MNEILEKTYYGNTIQEWLTCFGIIIVALLLGRILYWVSSRVVKKLTQKTETHLDDLVIDLIEEPIVAAFTLYGVWLGLKWLTLTETAASVISHLFQFSITMMIAWLVVRLLDAFYQEYLRPLTEESENDLDDQLLPVLQKGTKIIVWSMAVIIGLNNAGYDVGALIAGLGIGGLAFAMAAKDTVANIFGGFTIFTDKPFRINDRIKISGYDGTVTEIGVRSTRLKTLEGRTVTIPNSTFAENPVENISWEPSRKIILDLGLTYDTTSEQMEQAQQLLQNIADSDKGVEDKTTVYFSGFGDFAMNIKFIYYIHKDADIASTQNRINMQILKQFSAEKLDFAFPTQTLYNING